MDDRKKATAPDPTDVELERDIRLGRKFSLAEAIGRLGGENLLKGTSPVTRKRQAELEIEQYLEQHLIDAESALEVVLLRHTRTSEIFLESDYEQPLVPLAQVVERILSSAARLHDFVNDVEAEWGRIHCERPHFHRNGAAPDPDDPYPDAAVRKKLEQLLKTLRG